MNYITSFNQVCHHHKGICISSDIIQGQLLSRYGLTSAELLRPFFKSQRKVKLKLGLKDRETDFSIDLMDLQEYDQIGNSRLDKTARQILLDEPQNEFAMPLNEWSYKAHINNLCDLNKMTWFHGMQQVIADAVGYNYHLNFMDQPIVIVYVVSGESEVIKEVEQLKVRSEQLLRRIFKNNIQDLDLIRKMIVILNDAQGVVQFDKTESVTKAFPNHFPKALQYNVANATESSLFNRYATKRYFIPGDLPKLPQAIVDDFTLKQYRVIFEDFITQQVIPSIERYINILTQQYLEVKQRTMDNFFGFLKRSESIKQDTDYVMSQKEYLFRYLGDQHYLFGDYDSAQSYYKQLRDEMKNNKSNTTVAQLYCQEYYLYAKILANQKVDNQQAIFEELLNGYSKQAFPFILRVMYFYIYLLNAQGRFSKESIFYLQRCHKYFKDMGQMQKPDNFAVFNTLTYEQVAYLYLRYEPPQFRKFAHNLTLVASKYDAEGFKMNSLRCYKTVELIYGDSNWTGVLFWLEGHIGANQMDIRKVQPAIEAFKLAFNLLNDRQTMDLHNQLVVDWKKTLSAIEQVPNYSLASKTQLKMPIIKGPIDILTLNWDPLPSILQQHQKQKNKNQWSQVVKDQCFYEDQRIRSLDVTYLEERINCFNKVPCILKANNQDMQEKYDKFARHVFVGEDITLRIHVSVPLKVASNIDKLKILHEFYGQASVNLLDMDGSSDALEKSELPVQLIGFQFSKATSDFIQVSIRCTKPGYLIITGVAWNFLEIPTQYQINYDQRDQTKKKSVNWYNKFKVFPRLDLIEVSYETPPSIVFGEIRPIIFMIKNNCDHDLNLEIHAVVPLRFGFTQKNLLLPAQSYSDHTLYIRCGFSEDFVGQLLFKYYKGGVRVQKIEIPLKFEPSFKINIQSDLTVDYWKFTLQVQDYFGGKGKLVFNRILCLNECWEVIGQHNLSQGDYFALVTFQLRRLMAEIDQNDARKRVKEQFFRKEDKYGLITLTQEQPFTLDVEASFVNLDIKHFFTLTPRMDDLPLFLAASWTYSDSTRTITGLHELPILSQNHFSRLPNELPVSLKIDAPSQIHHNFDNQGICAIPVVVHIKNSKSNELLELSYQLYNGDEPIKSQNDLSQQVFLWEGVLQGNLTIKPYEAKQLFFKVLFFADGVYDLSRVRIIVGQKDFYSIDYEATIIRIN